MLLTNMLIVAGFSCSKTSSNPVLFFVGVARAARLREANLISIVFREHWTLFIDRLSDAISVGKQTAYACMSKGDGQ
jgi:hypothetical protein